MPTYDYRCRECEHTFEHYQSITAKPLRRCPKCGMNKVIRLIGTGSGVIFKGSGFHQTDYRSADYQKSAKAEKESSSSAGGSEPGKSQTQKDAPGVSKQTQKSDAIKPGGKKASPPPSRQDRAD